MEVSMTYDVILPDWDAINEIISDSSLEEIAEEIKLDFESTTDTWEEAPDFTIERINRRSISIGTDNPIYAFLNYGTSLRWAVMDDNFSSKTRPGNIKARSGYGGVKLSRGGVELRGQSVMNRHGYKNPKPGIEARRFDDAISAKWQKEARKYAEKGLAAGLQKAGNRIFRWLKRT